MDSDSPGTRNSFFVTIRESIALFSHAVSEHVAGWAIATGNGTATLARRYPLGCTSLVLVVALAFVTMAAYRVFMDDRAATTEVTTIASSTLAPGEKQYKIVANDTLSGIAAQNKVTVDALRKRNAPTLDEWRGACLVSKKGKENPSACVSFIIRGGTLVIPASDKPATSPAQ